MLESLTPPERYFAEIRGHSHIVCFGAGSKARQSLPLLRSYGVEPVAFCDNNPELWGQDFEPGLPILSHDEIRKCYSGYCLVLTTTLCNAATIRRDLFERGETCDVYHVVNPFKVDNGFLSWQSLTEYADDFKDIGQLLADKESIELYAVFLQSKITGNLLPLLDRFASPEQDAFFDLSLMPTREDHVYVDVGAYTGDTIMQFLIFSGGRYKQIIGFEPDSGNCAVARDFVRYSWMPHIEIRNHGLWSSHGTRFFYTVANNNEQHYDSPNFYRSIDHALDNKYRMLISSDGEQREEKTVFTLDEELADTPPSILKVNALAADLEVLKGGAEIIRRHRPAITMEYGFKVEYILETPRLLLSLNPGYCLYLRQKYLFGDCKTVLYAIPS